MACPYTADWPVMAIDRPSFLVPLNVVAPEPDVLAPPQAATTGRGTTGARPHRICLRTFAIMILSSWSGPLHLWANARLPGVLRLIVTRPGGVVEPGS